jgi:hypothetical protein
MYFVELGLEKKAMGRQSHVTIAKIPVNIPHSFIVIKIILLKIE